MPGFIKTPADERKWQKAKAAAKKSMKVKSLKTMGKKRKRRFYSLVTHIFKRMH